MTEYNNTHRVIVLQEEDYPDGSTYYSKVTLKCDSKEEADNKWIELATALSSPEVVDEGIYDT